MSVGMQVSALDLTKVPREREVLLTGDALFTEHQHTVFQKRAVNRFDGLVVQRLADVDP